VTTTDPNARLLPKKSEELPTPKRRKERRRGRESKRRGKAPRTREDTRRRPTRPVVVTDDTLEGAEPTRERGRSMWRLIEQAAKSATANASGYVSTVQEKAQSLVATVQDEASTFLHAIGSARVGPVDEVRRRSRSFAVWGCVKGEWCSCGACRFCMKRSTRTRSSVSSSRPRSTRTRSPRCVGRADSPTESHDTRA
jgi:hypothetical protein